MTTTKKKSKKTAKARPSSVARGLVPRRDVATKKTPKKTRTKRSAPKKTRTKRSAPVQALTATEIDALRTGIEERAKKLAPDRWNANPEDVQKSVAQLVLTLVEFLRQLMERQAIRRMEEGSFTDDETERVGLALMKLEQTLHELCARFDLAPEDLQLQLGPLGRLI